jgi:hypothetical protein
MKEQTNLFRQIGEGVVTLTSAVLVLASLYILLIVFN